MNAEILSEEMLKRPPTPLVHGDRALPGHLSQGEGRGHDLGQRGDLPPLVRPLRPEDAARAGVDEDRGGRTDALMNAALEERRARQEA